MRFDLRGVKAVAAHLGIATRTAFRYARDKHDPLPIFDFKGRGWLARRADIDAWQARQLRAKSDPRPATEQVVLPRRRIVAA